MRYLAWSFNLILSIFVLSGVVTPVRSCLRDPFALPHTPKYKYQTSSQTSFIVRSSKSFLISILTMNEQDDQNEQDGPKYVIDLMFGGRASYDVVVGPGAPESRTSHERVWPAIPAEYYPPPPEVENAVKEGMYFVDFQLLMPTIDSSMYPGLSSTRFDSNAIAR